MKIRDYSPSTPYEFDGTPVGITGCPACGQDCIIASVYLGGLGDHMALRCSSCLLFAPLFFDPVGCTYMPGEYMREGSRTVIVPTVIIHVPSIPQEIPAETIFVGES